LSPESQVLPKKLAQMSCQKFASNVVDKLVQKSSSSEFCLIIEELVSGQASNKLESLVSNQYSNFVLQNIMDKAVDLVEPDAVVLKTKLLKALRTMLENKNDFF
jgi:hypothetical protein